MADRFSVELPTEPEALALDRALLRRWLRARRRRELEIAEITTACGEAATNAIEHAGPRTARLRGHRAAQRREVEIAVRDHGTWRPEREGDRGRGSRLMRTLMDTVEVTPTRRGPTVRLQRTRLGSVERRPP